MKLSSSIYVHQTKVSPFFAHSGHVLLLFSTYQENKPCILNALNDHVSMSLNHRLRLLRVPSLKVHRSRIFTSLRVDAE